MTMWTNGWYPSPVLMGITPEMRNGKKGMGSE